MAIAFHNRSALESQIKTLDIVCVMFMYKLRLTIYKFVNKYVWSCKEYIIATMTACTLKQQEL